MPLRPRPTVDTKVMVRLVVNGEDYGRMSQWSAECYIDVHRQYYPEEPAYYCFEETDAETSVSSGVIRRPGSKASS